MVKNLPANAGNVRDMGLIPRLGRSPGGRLSKPTPVFFPRESHGQRSLSGYSPQGRKESDTTERLSCMPTRLLCPWNSSGRDVRVGCHSLLQGIFLTWGLNPGLLYCRQIVYCLSPRVAILRTDKL